MAKLFLGLAIALMLAAAVLGFLAKGNIDTLQGQLKQNKGQLLTTQNNLRTRDNELKKTTEDLTAANTKIEGQTTEISGLKKDKEELGTQLATVRADLETKTKFIADLEEKLKGTDPTKIVDVNTIVAERDQLRNDLTKAQSENAELKQLSDTLTARMGEKEAALGTAQQEVNRYRANVARNGLTGRVLAVNPGWNFVVLSVGDKQGATTGATMIVTRGGEAIGKTRITSVEPSTSIADLVPGSFRRGVTIQPGDVVVYEGSRAKPNTLSAPGPGAPLPQN